MVDFDVTRASEMERESRLKLAWSGTPERALDTDSVQALLRMVEQVACEVRALRLCVEGLVAGMRGREGDGIE